MKIALDVLGGDNAPYTNIEGAASYINEFGDSASDLILVGDSNIIKSKIIDYNIDSSKINIIHTTDAIDMNARSSRVFREQPNSSLVKSIKLVADGSAQAVVSAGNTGALLSSALFLIGKISGIKRPAFAPYIPNSTNGFILCDVGANVDTKPIHLIQFALMAEAYIKHLKNLENPKVALLNIGLEENKGNELTKSTYPILKEHFKNFIGNIESRDIMNNKADVVICDGFTGNIVLKLTEGIIAHIINWIYNDLKNTDIDDNSKYNIKKIVENIILSLDHEEHGATPLLGINGIVMKCHGAATPKSIKNAIIAAQNNVKNNLVKEISNQLLKHSNITENQLNINEANVL